MKKAQTAGRAINHYHIGSTPPTESAATEQQRMSGCIEDMLREYIALRCGTCGDAGSLLT